MKYVFEKEVLPKDFRYPDRYVEFVESGNFPSIDKWWFIGDNPEYADLAFNIINNNSDKPLVPFAKCDDSDDIACFDGDDTTGNPRVYFDTGKPLRNIDWSSRYSVTFDEWLKGGI